MRRGLVIGKFYPPHVGHQFLIDRALSEVDWLDVLVCYRPDQTISGNQRAAWLRELCPCAHVRVVEDFCDDDNSQRWAEYTRAVLGYAPDVVFTSESYGDAFARFLGCEHAMVDRNRSHVPISATAIREHPLRNLQYLSPCVRAYFVRRVCVLGAESTGTTTLAEDLARHYRTVWVPEYGRNYSVKKMVQVGEMRAVKWTSDDFIQIAQTQLQLEDEAARQANRVLICDTDALATAIWHERYIGSRSDAVEALSRNRHYDLYLLTDCDIPFVQDGTRDGEHIRAWMTNRFKEVLTDRGVQWVLVSGNRAERIQIATRAIDETLKD